MCRAWVWQVCAVGLVFCPKAEELPLQRKTHVAQYKAVNLMKIMSAFFLCDPPQPLTQLCFSSVNFVNGILLPCRKEGHPWTCSMTLYSWGKMLENNVNTSTVWLVPLLVPAQTMKPHLLCFLQPFQFRENSQITHHPSLFPHPWVPTQGLVFLFFFVFYHAWIQSQLLADRLSLPA